MVVSKARQSPRVHSIQLVLVKPTFQAFLRAFRRVTLVLARRHGGGGPEVPGWTGGWKGESGMKENYTTVRHRNVKLV